MCNSVRFKNVFLILFCCFIIGIRKKNQFEIKKKINKKFMYIYLDDYYFDMYFGMCLKSVFKKY